MTAHIDKRGGHIKYQRVVFKYSCHFSVNNMSSADLTQVFFSKVIERKAVRKKEKDFKKMQDICLTLQAKLQNNSKKGSRI